MGLRKIPFTFIRPKQNLPGGQREYGVVLYDQGEGHHQIIISRIEMETEIGFGNYPYSKIGNLDWGLGIWD